jgi:hypothetical protein
MTKSRWLVPIAIGMVMVTLGVPSASGQGQTPAEGEQVQMIEDIELTRAIIQAGRQAIVTRAMDVTEAKARAFWPLYAAYQNDLEGLGDRMVKPTVGVTTRPSPLN